MRRKNNLCAVIDSIFDRRQCTLDARVISYFAVFNRHIEIDTDKDPFPANINVFDSFFVHFRNEPTTNYRKSTFPLQQ